MDLLKVAANIKTGETALGIELGSTRIKAVLVNYDCQTIASGSYGWENALRDSVWTYSLDSGLLCPAGRRRAEPLPRAADAHRFYRRQRHDARLPGL